MAYAKTFWPSWSRFLLIWAVGHQTQVDVGEQFDSRHDCQSADQNDCQPMLLAGEPVAQAWMNPFERERREDGMQRRRHFFIEELQKLRLVVVVPLRSVVWDR